jgi:hypothetical protein
VIADLVKEFFKDLPEPLLTFQLYDDWIKAAGINDIVLVKSF